MLDVYIYAEPGFEGVVCVVVPNFPVFEALAESLGFDSSTSLPTLCSHPKLIQAVKSSLLTIGKLHNLAPYEIPSSLLLEPTPFSLENGLLTPSFKLSRPQLRKKYQDIMRELYYQGKPGLQPLPSSSSAPSSSTPANPSASSAPTSSSQVSSSSPPHKIVSFVENHTKRDWEELENEKIGAVGFDSVSIVQLSLLLKMVCSTFVPIEILLEMTVGELIKIGEEGEGVQVKKEVDWEEECKLPEEVNVGLRKRDFSSSIYCEIEELSSLVSCLSSSPMCSPMEASSVGSLASLPSPAPITVFLTGATGFLGIHILSLLLHLPSITTIYCLIRPSSPAPLTRLHSTAEYYSLSLPNSHKIVPIAGHLDQENFGLSASDFTALGTFTDIIIHNASWVNGVFPYSSLSPSNVLGTIQTLRLVSSASSRVSRYCYVSTLSVFGAAMSEPEDGLCDPLADATPLPSLSRLSGYASSKRVSEILLLKASRLGLPVSFVRPGTICGSHRNHVCNPNDFITKYFQGVVSMGVAPEWDLGGFSMVDVDYVGLLCVCASLAPFGVLEKCCEREKKEGGGTIPVFHATGEKGSEVTVHVITKAAQKAGFPVEIISFEEFRDKLEAESRIGDESANPLLPLKSYFLRGFPVGFLKNIGDENACNLIRRLEEGGGQVVRCPEERDLVRFFSLLDKVTKYHPK